MDGFKVAELLKERQPEEFRVLCETPVEWQDEGVESGGTVTFKKVRAHPTLQRDFDGRYDEYTMTFFFAPDQYWQPQHFT